MTEHIKNPQQPDPVNYQADDEINLLDLLLVLARSWKLIIGVCAATFILACLYSLTLPNIFTASARIMPPQQEKGGLSSMISGMGGLASLAGISAGASSAEVYVGMVNSRTIADTIIERFDLMNRFEWETRSGAYKGLNEKISASVDKNNGFITISVDDEDPQFAADVANALVEELRKLNQQINLNTAGRERVFLEERLELVMADMTAAEDALREFQEKNKAIRIDAQASAVIDSIARLKGEIASKEVELGVLLTTHTEQNPRVRALREGIEQLNLQLRRLQDAVPDDGNVQDIFISTADVPDLGLRYARLLRDFKIQETIFELISKQYEMAKISEAKESLVLQVLDEAYPPDLKSKPKRALMVLVATFAVGFMTVLFAFIREFGRNLEGEDRQRWEQIKESFRLRKRK